MLAPAFDGPVPRGTFLIYRYYIVINGFCLFLFSSLVFLLAVQVCVHIINTLILEWRGTFGGASFTVMLVKGR